MPMMPNMPGQATENIAKLFFFNAAEHPTRTEPSAENDIGYNDSGPSACLDQSATASALLSTGDQTSDVSGPWRLE